MSSQLCSNLICSYQDIFLTFLDYYSLQHKELLNFLISKIAVEIGAFLPYGREILIVSTCNSTILLMLNTNISHLI